MYLKTLFVSGFKNLSKDFKINFNPGLSVLVGENGVGKSAVVDAIRHILLEDEFGRTGIADSDFYQSFSSDVDESEKIQIAAIFSGLTHQEQIAFLPWTQLDDQAKLNLLVEKDHKHERLHRNMWGGESQSSVFEWELLNSLHCIYLPPLRDAEAKLREGKGSRLARLLKNLNRQQLISEKENGNEHKLVQKVKDFNEQLSSDADDTISRANSLIRDSLKSAIGDFFSQDTRIQFSETNFNSIVENLRLLFFPKYGQADNKSLFRELIQNSLGYNNLLYLATILAEFTNEITNQNEFLKLLLIEEPEAHLHPQLQIRLLKYLEEQAKQSNIQVIVTTHSPVLASAVSLNSIIHLSQIGNSVPNAVRVCDCGISQISESFLCRWLDITKSILFFSKGIIFVEGIAEAMVIPEMAKLVLKSYNQSHLDKTLPEKLDNAGISVINMNGIYFRHFMQLFCNISGDYANIPIRCSGITDNDPPRDSKPTSQLPISGNNPMLKDMPIINKSVYCRLFTNMKTFEYDLAMEGSNLSILIDIYLSMIKTNGNSHKKWEDRKIENWDKASDDEKKDIAFELLEDIEEKKGEFSQILAQTLSQMDLQSPKFSVPKYIQDAIIWACGGEI